MKTLYKRNTDGSTQEWTIEVDGNKYRTISGRHNGALVTSEWTTVSGKNVGKANQTTPEQQAMFEAKSKYTKKIESGYSEDVNNLDTELLKPQLAKEYSEHFHKMEFPVISSPKLDGIRINATKDGLFSRNGKPFVSIPHIAEALKPIFEKYPYLVLDGELFNFDLKEDFNRIISLVKKTKPTQSDMDESRKYIQFHVFDYFLTDNKNPINSLSRKQFVKTILLELNSEYVKPLEYTLCYNQDELDACYSRYLEEGNEGQMINDFKASYEHKRTDKLLKRKEFQDAEFKIVDIISGQGNREGCGVLILENNGKTFQCSLKGDVEYMRDVYTNRNQYIGKKATVKFQNYTPDGVPRFPVCINIDRENYE